MKLLGALYIYLLSLLPFFEGRFALAFGTAVGLSMLESLFITTSGTLTLSIALPYLITIIDRLARNLVEKRYKFLKKVGKIYIDYVKRIKRKKEIINKYGFLGLIVFVALPSPGTGIWTGSILGLLLRIERSRLTAALLIGGVISNLLVFYTLYMAGKAFD